MFGPKFQAWQDKNAGTIDRLGAIGVGLSQWDAGQPVDIVGAWDSIQNRRTQRKFGEAMRDPNLLANFTPEQQSMLSQMPPEMAQSLIMEKLFAPPPAAAKPDNRFVDGYGIVDFNNPPPDMMSGAFKPQVDPAPAPMSAEDRDFWGIPGEDPRAYVLGKDGTPQAVGDAPQGPDTPDLPSGYNWIDPSDPSKGVALMPGYVEKPPGSVTVNNIAGGTSTDGTPKVGPSLAEMQTSVANTVGLIDEIIKDPSLPGITGSVEGGGGNNVDDFNMVQRGYYGDQGLAAIQKIAQLQNTAWLAARDMLKGGGAITDYESKKAEGAMARLSRAQGTDEFKSALTELKEAISEGARKLQKAGSLPGESQVAAPAGSPAPNGIADFSAMTQAQVGQVDIGSLTPAQMDALEKRMTELGL